MLYAPVNSAVLLLLLLTISSVHGKQGAHRATVPPTTSNSTLTAVAVPIFHTENEGSSAMGQLISEHRPCVAYLAELLEQRFYNKTGLQVIYSIYFDPLGIKPLKLYDAILAHRRDSKTLSLEGPLRNAQNCLNMGYKTLIVAKFRKHSISDTKTNEKFTYYFTVRSDLFRVALSKYRDESLQNISDHPQFTRNFTAPLIRYHEKYLDAAVRNSVVHWQSHIEFMNLILHKWGMNCNQIKILLYEDFNIDPASFVKRWYDYAVQSADGVMPFGDDRAPQLHHPKLVGTKKVHSDDITKFVENSGEILAYFMLGNWPTLGNVLQGVGTKHAPCGADEFRLL